MRHSHPRKKTIGVENVGARKLCEFADGGERIATDAAFAVVCERAHGEQRSRFSIRGVERGDEEALFDFVDFVDANLRSQAQEPTKGDVGACSERRLIVGVGVVRVRSLRWMLAVSSPKSKRSRRNHH